jgi:hypothetical protein
MSYGCGTYPGNYLGEPIGGGTGCTTIYTAASSHHIAATAAELKAALAAASSGDVVYVTDSATLTLSSTSNWYSTGIGFYVPAGVILAGGAGGGVTAGIIRLGAGFYNSSEYSLIVLGTGAKVNGLHVDGPQDGDSGGNYWAAVKAGDDSLVYNNEIHGFGYAGVNVPATMMNVWIHHNYIHHIQGAGLGYPIVVNCKNNTDASRSYALIEGNRIDYYRHAVAAEKGRSSYTARYNYLGANGTNHTFDHHGQNDDQTKESGVYKYPAGDTTEIHHNTSLMASDSFCQIRGVPHAGGLVSVHHNWSYVPANFYFTGDDAPGHTVGPSLSQGMHNMTEYGYCAPTMDYVAHDYVQMSVYDNWWGSTPPPDDTPATSQPVITGISQITGISSITF